MAESPFDAFTLEPYPRLPNSQAWNAADALIAEIAAQEDVSNANTLLVNDEFGALCVATRAASLWTDSWLAQHASQKNLLRNQRDPVRIIWSDNKAPISALSIELVLCRVPKQLAYFEYQLSTLAAALPPGTHVVAAGMDKHLFANTAELLERYIGPTERHRGQRKARSFRAVRDDRQASPFAGHSSFHCETLDAPLKSLANGFSREKVDIGSRFLLENYSLLAPAHKMLDLACGNGILGLNALNKTLCEELLLCDESAMAIAAAKINAQRHFPNSAIQYHHGDGLQACSGEPAELIVCNPPFHHNHRVEVGVGRRLLIQSARYLKKGGRLCIVSNRHLDYLPALKREFSQVEKLAQNNKFTLWQAHR
ncbi:MAG: 23S rRNA (guanine1835-N2)-methyltransferase [Halioglobus sp.]